MNILTEEFPFLAHLEGLKIPEQRKALQALLANPSPIITHFYTPEFEPYLLMRFRTKVEGLIKTL